MGSEGIGAIGTLLGHDLHIAHNCGAVTLAGDPGATRPLPHYISDGYSVDGRVGLVTSQSRWAFTARAHARGQQGIAFFFGCIFGALAHSCTPVQSPRECIAGGHRSSWILQSVRAIALGNTAEPVLWRPNRVQISAYSGSPLPASIGHMGVHFPRAECWPMGLCDFLRVYV